MLVLDLVGAAITIAKGDFMVSISGMSLAAIVGILLNLLIPEGKMKEKELKHPLINHKLSILRNKIQVQKNLEN